MDWRCLDGRADRERRGDRLCVSDVEKGLASWLTGRISSLASPPSETSVGLWGERRRAL